MKKIAKKIPLTKKEADRTSAERLIRDLIFFAMGILITVFAYAIYDADSTIVEEEMQLYTAQNQANQIKTQELFSGDDVVSGFNSNSEDLQEFIPIVDPIDDISVDTEEILLITE